MGTLSLLLAYYGTSTKNYPGLFLVHVYALQTAYMDLDPDRLMGKVCLKA